MTIIRRITTAVCKSLACLLLLTVWQLPAGSQAQTSRLPSVSAGQDVPLEQHADSWLHQTLPPPDVAPVSYPNELSESLVPQDEAAYLTGRISSSKPGVFQKLAFTGTWLDRGSASDVGVSELELYGVFAFPFPTRDSPLIVTPGFEVRYLDGPAAPDLPDRVFDSYVQFRWLRQLNDRWGMDVAVSPGIHSDFEDVDDRAFRITGRSLASYQWHEDLKLILGVVYLDRDDVNLLPAAGLIWTPSDDARYELVFPSPRIAHRFDCGDGWEDWWYLAGEFGGGSWSIERAAGTADVVTMRDFRAIFGIQRKLDGGASRRIEVGWVFAREVQYASGTPDFEPDDTIMIRGGVAF